MSRTKKVETTLGNLIVALTEEATLVLRDPKVAHRWVSYLVADLMRTKQVRFRNALWTNAKPLQHPTALLH